MVLKSLQDIDSNRIVILYTFAFFGAQAISAPSTYRASSGYLTKGGHTIKSESWVYRTGGLYVNKYWKADEPDCSDCDTSNFKRDSVWVYLGKKKDTLRIETYRNGKLISEIKK